jgi:hypothetical protein
MRPVALMLPQSTNDLNHHHLVESCHNQSMHLLMNGEEKARLNDIHHQEW